MDSYKPSLKIKKNKNIDSRNIKRAVLNGTALLTLYRLLNYSETTSKGISTETSL